jgi:predicted DNA-binding mobile mystery protein A
MKPTISIVKKHRLSKLTESARHLSVDVPNPSALVQALRQRLGMSQAQLAKRAGLSQPHVALIEKGKLDLKLSTLDRLLKALQSELVILAKPSARLESLIDQQAGKIAKKRVHEVLGTMALEKQQPDASVVASMIQEEKERLLRRPSSELWNE